MPVKRILATLVLLLGAGLLVAGNSTGRTRTDPKAVDDLFNIDVEMKGWQPYKIAVTEPDSNDRPLGLFMRKITVNNLRIATSFKVLRARIYPRTWRTEGMNVSRARWRAIGTQGLIKARVVVQGARAKYEFALWDFAKGTKPVVRKVYTASRKAARRVVHTFCNEVMKHYTTRRGAFGTQIAFVATLGAKRKDVFVMDHDGHGLRRVSKKKSINILPAWSPSGAKIVFTSYVRRNPDLYITAAAGGLVPRRVSKRLGLNSGAVYSPDGKRAAITLTKDGNSEIYLLDTRRRGRYGWRVVKRLTKHSGIDTSPTWSPDGRRIAFVSSRYGYPQIWVMNADGTGKKRLTRRGVYNQTPTWCPMKGSNLIAFTSRRNGRFSIFTYNVKTQAYRRITRRRDGNNEEPTWSPNCDLLAFASSRGGIWVANRSGTAQTRIYRGRALQPRWGPWSTQH